MKQTSLHEAHVARKARLVDFAGWAMPLQYSGVLDEYHTVRTTAGLFDVSHMGRLHVEGPGALPFLQRVTTNDVQRVEPMGSQYSMICNHDGGVKDDIFLYRLGTEEFLLCVNASNLDKIRRWLFQQQGEEQGRLRIVDQSEDLAQLALQGPASKSLLQAHVESSLDGLKPRHCLRETMGGVDCLMTRTGYTGELGYELYVPATQVRLVWDRLMQSGEAFGLKPAGLGARDLLRLDMGYLLYGNDLTEAITPIEANAKWVSEFCQGRLHRRDRPQTTSRTGTITTPGGIRIIGKSRSSSRYEIVFPGQTDRNGDQREPVSHSAKRHWPGVRGPRLYHVRHGVRRRDSRQASARTSGRPSLL